MLETKRTKLSICILSALTILSVSACGGGGGGAGGEPTLPTIYNNGKPVVTGPSKEKEKDKYKPNNTVDFKSKSLLDRKSSIGQGVDVLISDTGIDLDNKDLVGKNISKLGYIHRGKKIEKEKMYDLSDSKHGTKMTKNVTSNAPGARITGSVAHLENHTVFKGWEAIGAAHKDMDKIDIVNTSWVSSGDNSNVNFSGFLAAQHVRDVINGGAVFVTAAGNNGFKNPNESSTLPLDKESKSIEHSYIVVAGADTRGEIIKDYNICGKAMNFCITSYAYYRPGNENETVKSVLLDGAGTSSATAYTSSVLAKIKSRYDWMENRNLKEVLFSTAIDKGDPGIDPVYGVGLTDERAALGGYGKFDKETVLNVTGKKKEYYFDNNISGSGSIFKNGSGSLVLNGNNTFSGLNVVNNGTLVLNGENKAPTKINKNGSLTVGNERKITSGSITNEGVINSLTKSDLVINGNLVSSGVINKNIGSKIDVKGYADLNNSKFIVKDVANDYITKNGKKEVLLTSNKLSGNIDLIQEKINGLIKSNIDINNKEISLVTKRESVITASESSDSFNGKEVVAKNIEETLSKFDKIVDNGGNLTELQNNFATSVLQASDLNTSMFVNSAENFKNANENILNNEFKQNNKFIKDGLSNNDVWIDYDYSKADIKINGLNGTGKNNNFTFGYANSINDSNRLAIGVSTKKYHWEESMKDVFKKINTDSNGIDLAYYFSGFNDYNLFTSVGIDWLKTKNGFDKSNGKQYSFMIGANKFYNLNDKFTLVPSLSVGYAETKQNAINVAEGFTIDNLKMKQTTATFDISAQYSLTDSVKLVSSVALSRDLNKKSKYDVDYAGVKVSNSDTSIGKTRVNATAGVTYSPVEKLNLSLVGGYEKGQNFKRATANVNVGYKF